MPVVPFKQVDVFTRVPFRGNPVAVVFGADGLEALAMQRIAAWTNLSETVYVLPPTVQGADYRLRIFTPRQELPFAGHPSIGAAHAVIEAGWASPQDGTLTQECASGLLRIRIETGAAGTRLYVRVPNAHVEPVGPRALQRVSEALGVSMPGEHSGASIVDVGPRWLVADIGSESAVRTLDPDMRLLAALCDEFGGVGINVFGRTPQADSLVVRSFAPGDGIAEDPVCGSGNAAVAAHLIESDALDRLGRSYRVSQGREVGRDGEVLVEIDEAGGIDIGGAAITCVDGTLRL